MPHLESSLRSQIANKLIKIVKPLFPIAVVLSLFLEALGKVLGSQLLQPCGRIATSLAHTVVNKSGLG